MSEKEPALARASRYHREADELRARADAQADDQKRADLLEISEAYERLADRFERAANEPPPTADHYRRMAVQARRAAERVKTPAVRMHLLGLARNFDQLAEAAESGLTAPTQ
jgi:hypothetical protein